MAEVPRILGLRIENLACKVELLQSFLTPTVALELIARSPRILSYSPQRLEHRLNVLAEQDSLAKLASAMTVTDEVFHRRFVAQKLMNSAHTAASFGFGGRFT